VRTSATSFNSGTLKFPYYFIVWHLGGSLNPINEATCKRGPSPLKMLMKTLVNGPFPELQIPCSNTMSCAFLHVRIWRRSAWSESCICHATPSLPPPPKRVRLSHVSWVMTPDEHEGRQSRSPCPESPLTSCSVPISLLTKNPINDPFLVRLEPHSVHTRFPSPRRPPSSNLISPGVRARKAHTGAHACRGRPRV
jgi:hypothetical protein